MYSKESRRFGVPLVLIGIAFVIVAFSGWRFVSERANPTPLATQTLYVLTVTQGRLCPSIECPEDALLKRGDLVTGFSQGSTEDGWVAIRLADEQERIVYVPRTTLTDERPARVTLVRRANAYACPDTTCALLGSFPAGTSFFVFSGDAADGWFRVEAEPSDAGESSAIIEYYLMTGAFTEAQESTVLPLTVEAETVSGGQDASWRISEEPSTVWTITDTPLYECPEVECTIVTMLPAGLYLNLGFTLAPDGWILTRYGKEGAHGYLSAGTLSTVVPERCEHRMTYSLAHIGQRFHDAGFSREDLETLLRDAEQEVERAVGWDFLHLTDTARSTVNFVISHYRDAEESHRGLHVAETTFSDEVVASFWIGVYAALLDDIEAAVTNEFIAPSQRRATTENLIHQTLMHELVHTTGFGHHTDPTGIMCGEPECRPASVDFTKRQALRSVDVEAIRAWCRS